VSTSQIDRRRMLVATLAVLALPGCATYGDERVEVHLADVALLETTLLEQRLRLSLRFQNRGNVDLAVDGLAYRIEASGTTLASGVSNKAFTIPRFGETRIDVEATSTLAGALRQVVEFQRLSGAPEPRLRYRIHGTANLAGSKWMLDSGSNFTFDTVNELPLPGGLAAPTP
jgi:LEA14-like dessication related protein